MWPFHPEGGNWGDLPTYEGETVVGHNTDQRAFTLGFSRRAAAFIDAHADEPFLVYLPHPMPHVPLHASDAWAGSSEQGAYGDVIQEIDAGLGLVLDALERNGLTDDTLVVFTSDNGPWLSYGDHAGSTGPLREGKGTTFEGGVRVPFVARFPGRIPSGSVQREPAMTIDLFPTIARLIGAELPAHPIDGRDVWPLLVSAPGARSPQDAYLFYYRTNELQAIRVGRWKLHFPHVYRTLATAPGTGGIPGKYDYGARTGLELYDLRADVGETTDVADQHPEVVALLEALADRARAELGDALTDRRGSGVREPGRVPKPTARDD
jgi:arylsulfatase A-like enzyme